MSALIDTRLESGYQGDVEGAVVNPVRSGTRGRVSPERRPRSRDVVRRGQIPFTRSAKKVLELALREALLHKDNEIRCEHIILGILRGGDRSAIALITEHVYTAQLRAAVIKLMDKAA
ncbi:Clp protease N-terminal domain-containing protein [Mycobacterium sp.]|uniref:Clp protease N-terminal domain-containing protein n=1 Tax=Mycobacterium sp. TaxID=1785 RepID=UPI003BB1EECB